MNSRFILCNLKEAEEQLRSLISQFEESPDCSFERFHVSVAHLYHHLNTAWNARNASDDQWRACTDQDFQQWQRFPDDLPLIGDDAFYDLPEYGGVKDSEG